MLRRFAPLLCGLVTYLVVVVEPDRTPTTDTSPGYYGALTLACNGDFNLGRIPVVHETANTTGIPYWAIISADGHALLSTFGPAPAVLGRAALVGITPGESLNAAPLKRRVQHVTGAALGLSAAAACLGALAHASAGFAIAASLVAALSFAGAPVLGQGLWQQTAALPFLMGGLAAALWTGRSRLATIAAPTLALLAALIRPADAALSLGILGVWLHLAREQSRRDLVAALGLAALCCTPLLTWNLVNMGTPLPIGQWSSNARHTDKIFDLSPSHLGRAIVGLLVSPARGLVIFAPIAIASFVALVRTRERTARILAASLLLQFLIAAMFFRWWGGVSFGPRLLAGAVWIAAVAAAAHTEWWVRVSAGVTLAVGLLGILRYDSGSWELGNQLDQHPERAWQVVDSPLVAMVTRRPPVERPQQRRVIFCPFGAGGHWAIAVLPSE